MRILVVDDNKENLYLMEVSLKGSGYEVVTAGNGAEALEKLHTESVDLIVSDILMPVMDGFQLCRKVKENDELKNIPFIFYTATYTDRKDEELALKLGSYKFIRKPAEPDEFIKIIQDMTRDVEKGKVVPKKPTIEEEEAFKLYSERLVSKLEKKMLDLEREVTERKRMEEEARKLAQFLTLVIDSTNVWLDVLDEKANVLIWNKAAEKITGYSREEVVGRSKIWEWLYPDQKHRKEVTDKAASIIQGGATDVEDETTIRTKSGEDRVISWYSRNIANEKGVPIGSVALGRDITERKKMEDELRRYTEQLEEIVEERTREIKVLNESIIQRLVQKIGQIDNVATIKDKLRRTPDISTGLDLILDTALTDLGMDVGAVLLIDRKENAAKLRGFKSRMEGIKLDQSYKLDKAFAEFDAYKENKNLSKIVPQGEPSILATAGIHCAPILFGREAYGILAFGSQKAPTLDESDLAVLSLYAELASTLFEMQSLVVAPVKEVAEGAKRKFELESGSSYLVEDNVDKAFEVFADNVLGGFEGLCITRQFPSKVRKKYGLEKTPIVWLTSERAEGETTVHSIQDLSILIANFLDKAKRGVVLLDGLEYLITNHGFEILIRFLQTARSRFEQKDATLIAPLLEKAIDTKEATLIEREMKPLIAQ